MDSTSATDSPPSSLDIYFLAIGGTGMAPLACLLQELGHRVRGTDGPLYPPMSTLLAEAGITPAEGWDVAHLDPPPDLVIVGNAIHRDNPEAVEVERRGIPRISMPEAVARFLLAGKRPLVVAGTHGKTTTTSMAAWAFREVGGDPGYLIGGIPVDLPKSFYVGAGDRFVIEGDEYNAAYFDRGAKFLHYRPQTLILTSAEYDHADLYTTPEALTGAYARLLRMLPGDGLLIACGDRAEVRDLLGHASCRVWTYGLGTDNDVRPVEGPTEADGACVGRVVAPGGASAELRLAVPGHHNFQNALAVWAAAVADDVDPQRAADALGGFRGVVRRLQELGTARGVTVIDDFAHHPTAVASSLAAVRERYPGRRVVVLFEARSHSAGRAMFQQAYREAFAAADEVLFAPLYHRARMKEEERLDLPRLCRELGDDGVAATCVEEGQELLPLVLARLHAGDVAVCMSSGSFEGIPARLLAALGDG